MSESDNSVDVVICGAGMVGLALALALVPSGLRLALLDRGPPSPATAHWLPTDTGLCPPQALRESLSLPTFGTRVSALTPASRDLLAGLGVWPLLEQLRVCPYTDMRVWDADGTGAIHFASNELHLPCLGHIAENMLITQALNAALTGHTAVRRFQPDTLVALERHVDRKGGSEQVLTLASGAELHCRLLIGADGASSQVRELAGFPVRSWDYGHRALVATVRTERPHQNTAWQRFMTTGPLAFLPLTLPGSHEQHHYCSIVWSCIPALAEELLALDDGAFARRLEQAFEARLGAIATVSPRSSFPLRQLHANDYVREGIALVGDAAHVIHPLAGQGVNLGFADVRSLAAVLMAAGARDDDPASAQVLGRYQRQRKPANLGMMLTMEGFKRVFGSEQLTLRWLRNTGLKTAAALTPLKHEMMSRAMGLKD